MKRLSEAVFRKIALLTAVCCIIIALSAYGFYTKAKKNFTDHTLQDLKTITDINVEYLVQWQHERISALHMVSLNNSYLLPVQEALLKNQFSDESLHDGFSKLLTHGGFENIFVVSADGGIIYSLDSTDKVLDPRTIRFAEESSKNGFNGANDFYYCPSHKKIHFDVFSPVLDTKGNLKATLIFRMDPFEGVSSSIWKWPIRPKSAEVCIIDQISDSLIISGIIKYDSVAIHFYEVNTKDPKHIASIASSGFEGNVEGKNNFDKPVLAYVKKVPDSSLSVAAQISKADIYELLNKIMLYLSLIGVLCILLVFFIAGWVYHFRQGEIYKDLYNKKVLFEKKMLQSEKKYRRLAENIIDVVWISDLNLNLMFVSPSVYPLIGETVEEHLASKPEDRLPEESLKTVLKILQEEMELENKGASKSRSRLIEVQHYRKDKSIIWVGIHVTFIRDEEGNAIGLQGVTRDITMLKNTEQQLRISEERFQLIMENSIDAILLTKANGKIITANQSACDLFNIHDPVNEVLPIDLYDMNTTATNEYLHAGTHDTKARFQIFETVLKNEDGTTVPLEVYSSKIKYQGEHAIVSIARNITQRKKDESIQMFLYEIARTSMHAHAIDELLDLIRNKLSQIIDTSNFYIALWEENKQVLRRITDSASDLPTLFIIENSLPGHILETGKTLLIKDDAEGHQYLSEHNLSSFTEPIKCWLGVPLIENNIKLGVIVFQSSHYNAYDRQSLKFIEMVAHETAIVFDRLNMMNNLIIAKEKAEESNRLKTTFLSNISHEIRTPLNGILGFIELLKRKDLDIDRRDKYFSAMSDCGHRLLETISNIVEVAKISSGQIEEFISLIDLKETMQTLYNHFRSLIHHKGIEFRKNIAISDEQAWVRTDKYKLDVIISNLLSNALKFTKTGFIEMGIYQYQDQIVFYIKDTGTGIPEEKMHVIFDRFMQIDSSSTRQFEGLGLGLSIVKAYIEALNGKIWIESEVGSGSTFYFAIPMEPEQKNIMQVPSNALKFTKTGFIEMGIYQYQDQIVFYIKDTGTGIPEEKMHVIFDRFMQIDSSSTRQFEGLGLGLSIVKAYIEALNGKIWIESEVGSGSTFYFAIPMEPEQKNIMQVPIQNASGPFTILIAEDDLVSFEFYKSLLEHVNINILQAQDGLETVRMAMEHPEISLILMDIRMPKLDGREASRRIRTFNLSVPIIAQTAYAFENDKIDCLEAGCNDFISKPIHPIDFMRIIKKYIPMDNGVLIG